MPLNVLIMYISKSFSYYLPPSLLSNQSESEMRTLWDNHVTASQVVFDHSEPETPHSYATSVQTCVLYCNVISSTGTLE